MIRSALVTAMLLLALPLAAATPAAAEAALQDATCSGTVQWWCHAAEYGDEWCMLYVRAAGMSLCVEGEEIVS